MTSPVGAQGSRDCPSHTASRSAMIREEVGLDPEGAPVLGQETAAIERFSSEDEIFSAVIET